MVVPDTSCEADWQACGLQPDGWTAVAADEERELVASRAGCTCAQSTEEMEAVGMNDANEAGHKKPAERFSQTSNDQTTMAEAPPSGTRKIRDLWPQFAFTFFYAVMFGGSESWLARSKSGL